MRHFAAQNSKKVAASSRPISKERRRVLFRKPKLSYSDRLLALPMTQVFHLCGGCNQGSKCGARFTLLRNCNFCRMQLPDGSNLPAATAGMRLVKECQAQDVHRDRLWNLGSGE